MRFTYFLVLCCLGLSISATAAPLVMTYEGQFEGNDQQPLTQPLSLEFSFWDAETNGNQVTNFVDLDESVIPTSEGYVTTLIGDDPGRPIPRFVFDTEPLYLNIKINGENLSPRKRMTSVGFSISSVDSIAASAVQETFVVADGEIISAGDFVSLNSDSNLLYVGDCPDVRNVATCPISNANASELSEDLIFAEAGGNIAVGRIAGTQINWSNTALFSVIPDLQNVRATPLSSTRFVLTYYDQFDQVYVGKIATISGNSLSVNNNELLLFGQGNTLSTYGIAPLSSSSFLVLYENQTTGNLVYQQVNNSGTTFTTQPEVVLVSSSILTNQFTKGSLNPLRKVSADKYLFFYEGILNQDNGTTINFGLFNINESPNSRQADEFLVSSNISSDFRFGQIRSDSYLLSYQVFGNSFISRIAITQNGYSRFPLTEETQVFVQSPAYDTHYLGNDQFEYYPPFKIVTVNMSDPENPVITESQLRWCSNQARQPFFVGLSTVSSVGDDFYVINKSSLPLGLTSLIGIATTSGSEGEPVKVALQGLVGGFEGLTPTESYTGSVFGKPVLDESRRFSIAITPDKLLLDRR